MRLIFDCHTHTIYSHGKGTIEDNVRVAYEKGLKAVAITDHGPGHLTYGIKRDKIAVMREEIQALQVKYPDMEIKLGVEANIRHESGLLDINEEDMKYFDIVLAGYHYGIFESNFLRSGYIHLRNYLSKTVNRPFKKLKIENTEAIVKALYNNNIDILTHPGYKEFVFIREIAKACADTDTLMEISNSHIHMTSEEMQEAAMENVKFVISSDAHVPEEVGSFRLGLQKARDAGIPMDRIVNISEN
ncbi:MAG: PHP domain-containing protein [Clostridiales bacterium]|nr:PHP domain-containing protein [Clostridiales bacterium]